MYNIIKGKMSDGKNGEIVSRIKTVLREVAFGYTEFYSAHSSLSCCLKTDFPITTFV